LDGFGREHIQHHLILQMGHLMLLHPPSLTTETLQRGQNFISTPDGCSLRSSALLTG
jgi:hypothetical protein